MALRTSFLAIALPLLGVTGCLLPDFENGVGTTVVPDGGGSHDALVEWPIVEDADAEVDADVEDATEEPAPDVAPDVDFCAANPEGTPCGEPGACHEMLCVQGACESVAIPDGVDCDDGPNACWKPGQCQGGVCGQATAHPDGHNWKPGDALARCCGGEPRTVNTNDDCGVCGIKCDTSDGQSCKRNTVNNRYYCEGCHASAKCWSGCCSQSYGEPYRCAASDCSSGACTACPSGAACIKSEVASNVCAYD